MPMAEEAAQQPTEPASEAEPTDAATAAPTEAKPKKGAQSR